MSEPRATACKVQLASLLAGSFTRQEGWQPSFVLLADGRQASRVNVLGIVTSRQDELNFILDDGSGSILVRSFENPISVEVADIVLVIGKPREYNGSKYISPEIVKKVTDQKMVALRKAELDILAKSRSPPPEEQAKEDDTKTKVLDIVHALDVGAGADYDMVVKACPFPDAEKIISKLVESGDLFQVRPGKLKVLE